VGIATRCAKGYRDKARPFVCACAGEVLSVTQPDTTVVSGNLLGWLLAGAVGVSKPDASFTI
jgi:hypothetical protein